MIKQQVYDCLVELTNNQIRFNYLEVSPTTLLTMMDEQDYFLKELKTDFIEALQPEELEWAYKLLKDNLSNPLLLKFILAFMTIINSQVKLDS